MCIRDRDKVAVLIPCYNESKTVTKVVEAFRKALPEAAVYVLSLIHIYVTSGDYQKYYEEMYKNK